MPFKGAVSAQKALQGSETETREYLGGTVEITLSLGSLIFHEKKTEKTELLARPLFFNRLLKTVQWVHSCILSDLT